MHVSDTSNKHKDTNRNRNTNTNTHKRTRTCYMYMYMDTYRYLKMYMNMYMHENVGVHVHVGVTLFVQKHVNIVESRSLSNSKQKNILTNIFTRCFVYWEGFYTAIRRDFQILDVSLFFCQILVRIWQTLLLGVSSNGRVLTNLCETHVKTNLPCSHRGLPNYPSVSDHKSFLRSRRLSPCEVHSLVILWK